jgi:hypothetical protein
MIDRRRLTEVLSGWNLGRIKNLPFPQHCWVDRSSGVVKRFGKEGEFTVIRHDQPHIARAGSLLAERVGQKIIPEIVPFSCYRVAFVQMREDGKMFEEFCDYQTGEGERLQVQKAELIEKRFTRHLTAEKCSECDRELAPDQFVAWHRGRVFCLRVKCLKGITEPIPPRLLLKGGAFAPGGTFDISYFFPFSARMRIEAIRAELVDVEIDSSLADDNISLEPIEDGVRVALRRAAEVRAKWASDNAAAPREGGDS